MKYIYSTLAILGLLGGVLLMILRGFNAESLLVLVFGAVCAVASEISELGEKFVSKASSSNRSPKTEE
jgi:hypothetical protein